MHVHKLPPNTLGIMYHVELNSRFEIENFLDWLGKLKSFPTSIYLQGITYNFVESSHRDMFLLGFGAAKDAWDFVGYGCIGDD